MGHRRTVAPRRSPGRAELTADLIGIGFNFAGRGTTNPNIEDTLIHAVSAGLEEDDLRTLAMLVTWWGLHSPRVNADRLTQLTRPLDADRSRAFWAALAVWKKNDRRFARMAAGYRGPRLDLLADGTDFHVRRHGEDTRFVGTCLRVAANVLRDRPTDVLTPEELARHHSGYRYRVMMGPSYRADMWAALDAHPVLTPAELARETYGSFATAWAVKQEWIIVSRATRRAA